MKAVVFESERKITVRVFPRSHSLRRDRAKPTVVSDDIRGSQKSVSESP